MFLEQSNFLYYYNIVWQYLTSDSITYPAVKYRKQRCVVTSLDSQKKENVKRKTMSRESLIWQMYHKGIFLCCANKMKCLCQWWNQRWKWNILVFMPTKESLFNPLLFQMHLRLLLHKNSMILSLFYRLILKFNIIHKSFTTHMRIH